MFLRYTICFCRCGDLVLMLYRNYPPNQHLWNGLGGKLRENETPLACVQREIMEEAAIDLRQARDFYFAGIVTWQVGLDPTSPSSGMYAFIADLTPQWSIWEGNRPVPEGLLAWKSLEWVFDVQNTAVVNNILHFLPCMLAERVPREYHCDYHENHLNEMIVRPLPQELNNNEQRMNSYQ